MQTRDNDFRWQTYYSTVPGLNQYILLTHAQSTNLSGAGSVVVASDNLETNDNPTVTLNHLGAGTIDTASNTYIDDIYNAYVINHNIMTQQGYTLLSPDPQVVTIDKQYIKDNAGSIFHYHGSCAEGDVVDQNYKVIGKDNLYIGDISVLSKPWGGSTSFPALVTGYLVSKN